MHVQYLTSQLAPPKMEVFDLELLTEELLVCTRARRVSRLLATIFACRPVDRVFYRTMRQPQEPSVTKEGQAL